MMLQNELVYLRAMEPEDAKAMYHWENDPTLWSLGDVSRPFSRAAIRAFIDQSSLDLHAARQLRLMIARQPDGETIGCIDLFDFTPLMRRAGVGILIYESAHRRQGYGSAALRLLIDYAFQHLDLRQLHADIPVSNTTSLTLFTAAGFSLSGTKRAWTPSTNKQGAPFEDALFVQLIR